MNSRLSSRAGVFGGLPGVASESCCNAGTVLEVSMRVLFVFLAVVMGCSTATVRLTERPEEPVGCCCAYGDCRDRFTGEQCASEGDFQGWTYAWHAGPCTETDR